MNAELQKAYDAELERHETVIRALAETRLHELLAAWDGTPMKMIFGMGTCYVEVNGGQIEEEDYPEIESALQDVEDITDNYRRACPENVEVK